MLKEAFDEKKIPLYSYTDTDALRVIHDKYLSRKKGVFPPDFKLLFEAGNLYHAFLLDFFNIRINPMLPQS